MTSGFVVHVVDTAPPGLTVPTGVTANATGPDGAAVSYTTTAQDSVDTNPTVSCDPPPNATFAIGDTTASCVAHDVSGNASAPAQFVVHVQGADEQLRDLRAAVGALPVPAALRSSLQAKLDDVGRALARHNANAACSALIDFVSQVNAQAGKKLSTTAATALTADATRIAAVVGCKQPG
jgi:hypothetical protein